MKKIMPLLLIDFYKSVHSDMLPQGITKSVSYFTPRMSRIDMWDEVVMFGLQGFIKEYLIDYFNEQFFKRPEQEVFNEYIRIINNTMPNTPFNNKRVSDLHKLGYLPIEIIALPEGTKVPMHVPMFGITNTHNDFAWLPQSLESLISAESWHVMLCATVANTYRNIVNKYAEISCDNNVCKAKLLGSFDFRGDQGCVEAIKVGSAWLTSFLNTATVPAIPYLEMMYNCDCTKEEVGFGSASTEHFVMCSNYAVDGDEITFLRRLLTEIYPNTNFSAVLDSYDYWNVIDNILPEIHNEIINHNGCMLMRGDSGDCVEVVTKTVFKLWEQFGGIINSKGFKVLNPHVKAIYGDSITIQRCEEIYKILIENGFSIQNVALGVGSFSMHCIEENGILKPFTRDTFSSCIKTTYCEVNGKKLSIFKNPKDGGFKKSQKGCCIVERNRDGKLIYSDEHTWEYAYNYKNNELIPVFKDGQMTKEYTLKEIRDKLHSENGGF